MSYDVIKENLFLFSNFGSVLRTAPVSELLLPFPVIFQLLLNTNSSTLIKQLHKQNAKESPTNNYPTILEDT